MPKTESNPSGQSKSSREIGKDAVSRIVSALQTHPRGATIRDLVEGLGVSRLTLLRRLHKMESDRLIYRTESTNNRRGRPEILYRLSDKPVQKVTNPGGTFFITEVGKGESRYNVLERTLDFRRINESIVELDEGILASSITDKLGNLKIASKKRGLRGRFTEIADEELEKWAPWIAIVSALASHHDELLGEAEYVAIGRKEVKSLLIPFDRLGLIVNLILVKTIEATLISQRVGELINRLANT